LAETGGSFLSVLGAPVLMVGTNAAAVEVELRAGRLACPACEGRLRPWGFARWRVLRGGDGEERLRPRRSRCVSCLVSHVLLPVVSLMRRRDTVEVIGAALVAHHAGAGHRRIAAANGVPATTVRGWLRRFAARSGVIAARFTALAHRLDPELGAIQPRGSPRGDALEAIGVAAAAATRRLGPAPRWQFVAGASGGRLLANTTSPFPGLP
jgi:hypothetical protein